MSNSLLSDAIELLRISESVIVNERRLNGKLAIWSKLMKSIEIIRAGAVSFISPGIRLFIYWGMSLLIIAVAEKSLALQPNTISNLQIYSGLLSFLLVAFALPSSYVSDSLSDAHIEAVALEMHKRGPFEKPQVEAVSKIIEELYSRALARINAFQWIMAASWAFATYLYSQYTGVMLKLVPADTVLQQLADIGMQLLVFAILSLLMLWAIYGYKRSVDKAFRLSKFTLHRINLDISSKDSRSNTKD